MVIINLYVCHNKNYDHTNGDAKARISIAGYLNFLGVRLIIYNQKVLHIFQKEHPYLEELILPGEILV